MVSLITTIILNSWWVWKMFYDICHNGLWNENICNFHGWQVLLILLGSAAYIHYWKYDKLQVEVGENKGSFPPPPKFLDLRLRIPETIEILCTVLDTAQGPAASGGREECETPSERLSAS